MRVAQRGFSLIEMLLVLFVIVVMTSLVTLNLDSGADGRERDSSCSSSASRRLRHRRGGLFSGRDFGLLVRAAGRGSGDPVVAALARASAPGLASAGALRPTCSRPLRLPPRVGMQLLLDGAWPCSRPDAAADGQSGAAPQWLLLASGETQAGELLWRNREDGDSCGLACQLGCPGALRPCTAGMHSRLKPMPSRAKSR
jgi:general secretion pathway protein H